MGISALPHRVSVGIRCDNVCKAFGTLPETEREFDPCCLHHEGDDEDGVCGHIGYQTILTLWITKRHPQFEGGSNLSQHGIQIKCEREQNQYKTAALQSDMNSYFSEKCY